MKPQQIDEILTGSFPEHLAGSESLDSPIEVCLYAALRRDGITPRTQVQIGPYRVDMAFPARRLVVECDGHAYHSNAKDRAADAKRDRWLLRNGWVTMRFLGTEIWNNPEECVKEIRAVAEARGARAYP